MENDLHARHAWLTVQRDDITRLLEGDPDWHDPKIAGWWVWGACCWIAGGWCSGQGPWRVVEDGEGVKRLVKDSGNAGMGVKRQLPCLGNAGMGVNRKLQPLVEWFGSLSDRLRRVRVCCGDWTRVCTPAVTEKHGLTAVFLDPPYADTAGRDATVYGATDSLTVAHDVRRWAIEHGDDPRMRIALCGYEGEHAMPESWECLAWKASGGYGNGVGKHVNSYRERVWFSPHCLKPHAETNGRYALICDAK